MGNKVYSLFWMCGACPSTESKQVSRGLRPQPTFVLQDHLHASRSFDGQFYRRVDTFLQGVVATSTSSQGVEDTENILTYLFAGFRTFYIGFT